MTPCDFALIAQEAYTAKPDIGVADSASRAIVRQTPAGLCVAFPGTDDVACWLADLDVLTVHVPGAGELHRGFWEAWQAISSIVLERIDDQKVTLVGHSLGAAIAIMAAAQMTLAGRAPAGVYGFEPPRVSIDTEIARLLSSVPLKLYKNGNDIVPDVPPEMNQAGPLLHIGKPTLPIPNVQDHMLDRVIPALT